MRGLERTFGMSRTSVIGWIKKAEKLPILSETVIAPDANDADATVLELDSFVSKDVSFFASAVGDRGEKTCQHLWEAIPPAYRAGHFFTDFWMVYQAVVPEEQHPGGGKETGETAPVERWNNTLRQRLARFVRKTL